MKNKLLIIILSIHCFCASFATNPILNVRKTDSKLQYFSASSNDSLKFTSNDSLLIYNGGSLTKLNINQLDSAYFTTGNLPSVQTVSADYNYTNNSVICLSKVTNNGNTPLIERGIVWAIHKAATIKDNKATSGTSVGQYYTQMTNLSLNGHYYVRAYATNCLGTTYGNEIEVYPLPGNITFTMGIDSAALPVEYKLIKAAMDSACWYFNRYTTFKGNIYVYYDAGIPTAQASYHGSIGFGASATYMWVGTVMHEICHFVGSGTTTAWKAFSNGNWTGPVASALLLAETGEVLKGDDIHFWPYGINYKSEITNLGGQANQQKGLILCAKLAKAMCVDDAKAPSSW
jgi:hypothetical protein